MQAMARECAHGRKKKSQREAIQWERGKQTNTHTHMLDILSNAKKKTREVVLRKEVVTHTHIYN